MLIQLLCLNNLWNYFIIWYFDLVMMTYILNFKYVFKIEFIISQWNEGLLCCTIDKCWSKVLNIKTTCLNYILEFRNMKSQVYLGAWVKIETVT